MSELYLLLPSAVVQWPPEKPSRHVFPRSWLLVFGLASLVIWFALDILSLNTGGGLVLQGDVRKDPKDASDCNASYVEGLLVLQVEQTTMCFQVLLH